MILTKGGVLVALIHPQPHAKFVIRDLFTLYGDLDFTQ
jgi:hypothetical protein